MNGGNAVEVKGGKMIFHPAKGWVEQFRKNALSVASHPKLTISAIALVLMAFFPSAAQPQTPAPCCVVTAIDLKAGVAVAKVNANSEVFEFKLTNPKALSELHVGEGVYANFKAHQVSLDGRTIAGPISSGPTAATRSVGAANLALNPVVSSAAGSSLGKGGNHPPADYGPVIAAVGCSVQSSAIDLVINALGFNPVRHAVYTIANCGRTATNLPFVVDVYMNGQRADTIEQKILPGRSQQTVTSSLAIDQGCSETTLLAIADPQKVITESSSESHQKTVQVSPPCPNLVVTDIKQVWEDLNTRYEVQFTIQNQGSGPPPIAITATESVAYDDAVLIPYDNYYQLEPLQPGQSVTFHDSKKHMMTETIDVEIILDMQHQISVVNPNNNISKKTLGPH